MTVIDLPRTEPAPAPDQRSELLAELTIERPATAGGPAAGTPEDEALAWWRRITNRVVRLNAGRVEPDERVTARVENLRSTQIGASRSARITIAFELPEWLTPESLAVQLRPIAPASSLLRCAKPTALWSIPV